MTCPSSQDNSKARGTRLSLNKEANTRGSTKVRDPIMCCARSETGKRHVNNHLSPTWVYTTDLDVLLPASIFLTVGLHLLLKVTLFRYLNLHLLKFCPRLKQPACIEAIWLPTREKKLAEARQHLTVFCNGHRWEFTHTFSLLRYSPYNSNLCHLSGKNGIGPLELCNINPAFLYRELPQY